MIRILICFLSLIFNSSAFAVVETIAPTEVTQYPDGKQYASPIDYCNTLAAPWTPSTITNTTATSGSCFNSGGSNVGGWYSTLGKSCPVSTSNPWTLNTTTQLCERTNSCVSGLTVDSGTYDIGTDFNANNGAPPLSICSAGCQSTYSGDAASQRALVGGVYHYYATGQYVTDGNSCSSTTAPPQSVPAPPAPTCAQGQSLGTVNGKPLCVNVDGTPANPNATPSSAPSTTNNTTTNSTTNTTTNNTTTGGNTSYTTYQTTTTTTTTTPNSNTNNPNNQPNCDPFNPTVGCMSAGTAPADSVMPSKSINVAITPVAVGGAGYCPAPITFTIAGRPAQMDFTTYCNYANMVRPLLLAFAWLTAAGILIGGFKTEG